MTLMTTHRVTGPIPSEQVPGLYVAECVCGVEFAAWSLLEITDEMNERGCLPAEPSE